MALDHVQVIVVQSDKVIGKVRKLGLLKFLSFSGMLLCIIGLVS